MSKVEEFLMKYNPEGVDNIPLWELTAWDKKFNAVDKSMQKKVIKYKYYLAKDLDALVDDTGDIRILYTNEKVAYTSEEKCKGNICEGEIVAIPWGGTPTVKYYNGKFVTGDNRIATSLDTKILNNKYLFYWMISQLGTIADFYRGAGIQHPSMISVLSMQIPLPHIKVQEEIVKILDSFTNLIDSLNEELSLRQKQFEYYREKLLTFDDNVNWDLFDNIGEITDYVANGSFADLKKNVKYLQESNYAILVRTLDLSSNFKNNNFVYIDKNAYDFLEKSKLFGGEIIINNVGAGVGTVFCCPKLERKMSLGPNSVVLKTDNNKFYYYWLSSKQGQDKIFQITSFSALPKFNKTSFKQILFPVIDEKIDADYIVEKLDAFESLISSLKEEIALRQKQYEYYREKLLTFD